MDIFESNKMSDSFTSHPYTGDDSSIRCTSDIVRHGVCEALQGRLRQGRLRRQPVPPGQPELLQAGLVLPGGHDQALTLITRFITSDKTMNSDLVEIKRFYKQNGKVIENPKVFLE